MWSTQQIVPSPHTREQVLARIHYGRESAESRPALTSHNVHHNTHIFELGGTCMAGDWFGAAMNRTGVNPAY